MAGGEQAGWAAVVIAVTAGLAQVIDRLIARWRPGVRAKRRSPDFLERERAELATEWEAYRKAVNTQLDQCRTESERLSVLNASLAADVTTLTLRVGMMRAQLVAHGIPIDPV